MSRPTTVDEAVSYLTRHAQGAPFPHFGDRRERSAFIAGRVARLLREDLQYAVRLATALCEYAGDALTRGQRWDICDVTHAMRSALSNHTCDS
ncbi:hypothetical protein ACWGJT_03220 [Streptomyces xantholiticus]